MLEEIMKVHRGKIVDTVYLDFIKVSDSTIVMQFSAKHPNFTPVQHSFKKQSLKTWTEGRVTPQPWKLCFAWADYNRSP